MEDHELTEIEQRAKGLYEQFALNTFGVFPPWEELSPPDHERWIERAEDEG